ncbi:hypothetical protein [Falsirhodobacter algicola]|uniref:Uncharacterized protein n=1 Tax=Falsirhodobacter algicola TaxID=2692330 RepID=A0A8J8MRL3_9RHOB|nr:hypothetical protein [Falsirhodobacter algicola]QUS35416.1 hypothetical protein GR316_03510 [Falsirhodobacter algicola]
MAEQPLSAIDWLSRSITAPAPVSAPRPRAEKTQPAPVVPSRDAGLDAAGLLSPRQTGLPRDLWGSGPTEAIAARLTALPDGALPALHDLMMRLLLAEATPPRDAKDGTLFLARIDKLLQLGALDQAQALLEAAGSDAPGPLRRIFDIALLLGTENDACGRVERIPGLAPTFPARIFCLARSGDWNAAALTLRTGEALDLVPEREAALLARFLDPDLYEGEPVPPVPERMTPLVWRLYEAIGEPLPTYSLPIAFAHAELRETAGWKAQLDAAERLTRAGVLDPNHLLGLYTLQRPAASGGVWDRVAAVQAVDSDISNEDTDALQVDLPRAVARMQEAELLVPLSRIFAKPLLAMDLPDATARQAFRLGLLSGDFEDALAGPVPENPLDRFLASIARGEPDAPPADDMARSVQSGLTDAAPPDEAADLIAEGRTGEALMLGIERLNLGAEGDLRAMTEGLGTLRALGLDQPARRVAIQALLLGRT